MNEEANKFPAKAVNQKPFSLPFHFSSEYHHFPQTEYSVLAMEEGEIKIEVRALTGETITVSMLPEKTVNDLKLLLQFRFPPAATSANFHLFFKAKLPFTLVLSVSHFI